ncbi:MAG: YitT family protein [Lentisphaerae bacterium]|nr:YitT family protein [Lentisphaerota bacterium]
MLKRLSLFLLGLVLAGLGVALSTRPELGTSPITSLPYVTTFVLPWTLGMATVVINIFFIAGQMLLLKRRYPWRELLQLPTLLVFGFFIDLGMFLTGFYIPENYLLRLAEVIMGCCFLAAGISCQLSANISLMPGDGFIRVLAQEYKWPFGVVKICFDSSIVLSAIIFSLIFFQNITGVREGTLIAAVLVGFLIKQLQNAVGCRPRKTADKS